MGIPLDQAGPLLDSLVLDTSHVRFNLQDAPPPSELYVTEDDTLQISAVNLKANASVLVSFRHIDPAGALRLNTYRPLVLGDGAFHTFQFPLAEGYLLGLAATLQSGNFRRGEFFLQVSLVRGLLATPDAVQVLLSDYITDFTYLAFPGAVLRSPADTTGRIVRVVGTDPAAGQPVVETVPSLRRWRLITLSVVFRTDATVANRRVFLDLGTGLGTAFYIFSPTIQAASSVYRYTFSSLGTQFSSTLAASIVQHLPLPPEFLLGDGDTLRVTAENLQAGDNFDAPTYSYVEWLNL